MNRDDILRSRLREVFLQARAGEVLAAVQTARTLLPTLADPAERQQAERFLQRFTQAQRVPTCAHDPVVDEVLGLYEAYWRAAMLAPGEAAQHEAQLQQRLRDAFAVCRAVPADGDVTEALGALLRERGWQALFGRTWPYLELLVWRTQTREQRHLVLPDSAVDIEVLRLDDFASLGWCAHATLDLFFVGGWAVGQTVHAVMPAWAAQEAEAFEVRLLAHEAQHCADGLRWPGLASVDLEFRAKLTELQCSRHLTRTLADRFRAEALGPGQGPHAQASRRLLVQLPALQDLPAEGDPDDAALDTLRTAARECLLADTAMRAAGAPRT